jgi:membrane protease YdiL (CAAX protease family)
MTDIMPPPPPKRVLPDRPVGWELLLFVLVFGLIVVVGLVLMIAIGDVAFGPQSGDALRRGSPEPGNTAHAWAWLSTFAVFYLAVVAAIWISMYPHGERRASALGLRGAKWQWYVFGTIAVLALSQLADALLLPFLRDAMAIGADELLITQVVRALTATPPLTLVALLVLGVLGPIAEELVFRGLLYGWLRGFLPFWLTAILTSVLFGLVHGEWAHVIVATILGFALAVIRERSGSLWPPILAHCVNNLVAVGAAAFFGI